MCYLLISLECLLRPIGIRFVHCDTEGWYVLRKVLGQQLRRHVGPPVHEILLGGQHGQVLRLLAAILPVLHSSHALLVRGVQIRKNCFFFNIFIQFPVEVTPLIQEQFSE